ncbi:MAG TPA: hypothetical protein VN872_07340, partial [Candidatus Acidoferrum sp.]|nr:hypothetical protein [Candidatus Acidoferrum sp.]
MSSLVLLSKSHLPVAGDWMPEAELKARGARDSNSTLNPAHICYHLAMPVDTEIQATHLPPLKAPRGTELTCKGWPQEAAMRMLMNNLDPEVAEDPDRLVVYGGSGKAARTWEAFDTIVAALRKLEGD